MIKDSKCNYAFMFANWYSGATLLAILLNNHKNLTCNGETFPFKPEDLLRYRCSCGMDLMTCEFYRKAGANMLFNPAKPEYRRLFAVLPIFSRFGLIDKWLKSFNYFPGLRNMAISYIPSLYRVARTFVELHKQFFVDSTLYDESLMYIDGTKSLRRAELFTRLECSESFRVIYMIRDGRGFCWSFLKNRKLSKKYLKKAAKEWNEHIQVVDRFKARYPKIAIKTIRYEDFVRDTEKISRGVSDFLEVPYDENIMKEKNKAYHILGNQMRKQFNWHIKEDLSWKTKFTKKEIDIMTQIMRSNLKRFNYLIS